jgi:hypothetical protein
LCARAARWVEVVVVSTFLCEEHLEEEEAAK